MEDARLVHAALGHQEMEVGVMISPEKSPKKKKGGLPSLGNPPLKNSLLN
jgi:hypothetical protein